MDELELHLPSCSITAPKFMYLHITVFVPLAPQLLLEADCGRFVAVSEAVRLLSLHFGRILCEYLCVLGSKPKMHNSGTKDSIDLCRICIFACIIFVAGVVDLFDKQV